MQESGADFKLHPQLEADTFPVARLALNDVLLINDSRYVWCILVPRLPNLSELHDLPAEQRARMHDEVDSVSVALKNFTNAYKMNVAALGNMVEQLHVHVIARKKGDAAWPGPVWGVGVAEPYSTKNADALIYNLRNVIS